MRTASERQTIIHDTQGWGAACDAMRREISVDPSACADQLSIGLGRAGAVLRALKGLMANEAVDEFADDRAYLVDVVLEEVEKLSPADRDVGAAADIDRLGIEFRDAMYFRIKREEELTAAANALMVAASPESDAVDLDIAAKALWRAVEANHAPSVGWWDSFGAALADRGLVVSMNDLGGSVVPEVMTADNAKNVRKARRMGEQLGRKVVKLERNAETTEEEQS